MHIERERRMHEEQQRRLREEQERRAKEQEEQERRERERRLREEKDRERQERERRERERVEEERTKREREQKQKQQREELEKQRLIQQQRLGKRPFPDSIQSYDPIKRPALHDVRGGTEEYSSPSSVFGRLDPPTQKKALVEEGMGYRRNEPTSEVRVGGSGNYRSGFGQAGGREGVGYPLQASTSRIGAVAHPSASGPYGKLMGGFGLAAQQMMKPRPAADLSRVAPEIISAATRALENIRKTVQSAGGQVVTSRANPQIRVIPQPTLAQVQQLAATRAAASLPDFIPLNPQAPLGAGIIPASGMRHPFLPTAAGSSLFLDKNSGAKLPPEDERYNRRLNRPPPHQARQSAYKRLV